MGYNSAVFKVIIPTQSEGPIMTLVSPHKESTVVTGDAQFLQCHTKKYSLTVPLCVLEEPQFETFFRKCRYIIENKESITEKIYVASQLCESLTILNRQKILNATINHYTSVVVILDPYSTTNYY
eukprot:GHVR01063387.1.p1 GENE.GHVR01063387.1~~GHVR01063387.1.p1  ORF type:complete len:125 (+),score=0.86 GHVR01063387.1:254-628(+)